MAVKKLLEYHANPNLIDVHGNSALFEATKNNHEDVAEILLKHGGELSMSGSLAATTLCQAVYDGDILMLKRLLNLVGNSAGTAPLAGGSGIGISASDFGIPEICVGKTRANLGWEGN